MIDDRSSYAIFEFKILASCPGPFPESKEARDHLALSIGIYTPNWVVLLLGIRDWQPGTFLYHDPGSLPFLCSDDFDGETQTLDAPAFIDQTGELI